MTNSENVKNGHDMPVCGKVPIELKKVVATKVEASDLKKELNRIGLTCAHTEEKRLEQYIQDVVKKFKGGKNQGFGTYEYRKEANIMGENAMLKFNSHGNRKEFFNNCVVDLDINNSWDIVDEIDPYTIDLSVIGMSKYFDFLKDKYIGFPGNMGVRSINKEDAAPEVVKETFLTLANSLASSLIDGIDEETLESFLAHLIKSVPEGEKDYNQHDERFMFIVQGYDPEKGECESVGVVGAKFSITIKNYANKKENPNCYINVEMRSFMSSDPDEIKRLADYVRENYEKEMKRQALMPIGNKVKVFETLPQANEDTFNHSVMLEKKGNLMSALVFYSPNIENIGMLDNRDSSASSQYSKTITSGFTFTEAEKIGANVSCEIGCEFAKMSISMNMEVSMTEQWNKSQSETISFTVPGKQRAYMYQFYIHTAILYYDLETFKFYYGESGRFLTNVVRTSEKSLIIK